MIIKELCKLLNLQIGEVFGLTDENGNAMPAVFRFTENGLQKCKEQEGEEFEVDPGFYTIGILQEIYKVIKLPFNPREGETFWHIMFGRSLLEPTLMQIYVSSMSWHEWSSDAQMMKHCGNRFRTEKEANDEKFNFYKKMTGKEWGQK